MQILSITKIKTYNSIGSISFEDVGDRLRFERKFAPDTFKYSYRGA